MGNRFTYMGKPNSFNSYAAGAKIYGISGSSAPNVGPVDPTGYKKRDAEVKLRRNALLRRMQAGNSKHFMSADWLGGKGA